MGWFSISEEDVLNEINKVNAGISVIRETIRITGDDIVDSNKDEVAIQMTDCLKHFRKYKDLLSRMDSSKRISFLSGTVHVWNGEIVPPLVWESYFKEVVHVITNGIRALD